MRHIHTYTHTYGYDLEQKKDNLLSLPFALFGLKVFMCLCCRAETARVGDRHFETNVGPHRPGGWTGLQRSWLRFQIGSTQELWTLEQQTLLWAHCCCSISVPSPEKWQRTTQDARPSQGMALWKARIKNREGRLCISPYWCKTMMMHRLYLEWKDHSD